MQRIRLENCEVITRSWRWHHTVSLQHHTHTHTQTHTHTHTHTHTQSYTSAQGQEETFKFRFLSRRIKWSRTRTRTRTTSLLQCQKPWRSCLLARPRPGQEQTFSFSIDKKSFKRSEKQTLWTFYLLTRSTWCDLNFSSSMETSCFCSVLTQKWSKTLKLRTSEPFNTYGHDASRQTT